MTDLAAGLRHRGSNPRGGLTGGGLCAAARCHPRQTQPKPQRDHTSHEPILTAPSRAACHHRNPSPVRWEEVRLLRWLGCWLWRAAPQWASARPPRKTGSSVASAPAGCQRFVGGAFSREKSCAQRVLSRKVFRKLRAVKGSVVARKRRITLDLRGVRSGLDCFGV